MCAPWHSPLQPVPAISPSGSGEEYEREARELFSIAANHMGACDDAQKYFREWLRARDRKHASVQRPTSDRIGQAPDGNDGKRLEREHSPAISRLVEAAETVKRLAVKSQQIGTCEVCAEMEEVIGAALEEVRKERKVVGE